MEEAGEGRAEVCVLRWADVNKRIPRCRGAAGSTAPPVRRPCFRQSATAAPCPPRWSAAPCPSSAPAAGCRETPWRTRPRGRTQTCRRISRRPPGGRHTERERLFKIEPGCQYKSTESLFSTEILKMYTQIRLFTKHFWIPLTKVKLYMNVLETDKISVGRFVVFGGGSSWLLNVTLYLRTLRFNSIGEIICVPTAREILTFNTSWKHY